jgi:hydroxymethylglutaryl-CoA lyase
MISSTPTTTAPPRPTRFTATFHGPGCPAQYRPAHVAHFHSTRGWGLANVLAALQAGIDIFEGTLGGLGGQLSNFLGDCPVPGTGAYYYKDPNVVGLTQMEDMVVMMDEMGIETGIDVDRVLELGTLLEKTIGRRLRSE